MPITTENVTEMLQIAAQSTGMELDNLLKLIHRSNQELLPKALKERVSGSSSSVPTKKDKSPFARKATEEFARDLGIEAEEITIRTGNNDTIVLADVKAAFKAKKLAQRKTEGKPKTKAKVPVKSPEPSDDDGEEFEDE